MNAIAMFLRTVYDSIVEIFLTPTTQLLIVQVTFYGTK
jgi:hypothetical protein